LIMKIFPHHEAHEGHEVRRFVRLILRDLRVLRGENLFGLRAERSC